MVFGICDFFFGWERLDFFWGGGGFGFLLGILGLVFCVVILFWDFDFFSFFLFFIVMVLMIFFSNLLEGFGRILDFGVEVLMLEFLISIWWSFRIEMFFGGSSGLDVINDIVLFREILVFILIFGFGNRLFFFGGGGGGIFLGFIFGLLLFLICLFFFRLRLGILEFDVFLFFRLVIGVDVLIFRMILDDFIVFVDFIADEIFGMFVGFDRVVMEI